LSWRLGLEVVLGLERLLIGELRRWGVERLLLRLLLELLRRSPLRRRWPLRSLLPLLAAPEEVVDSTADALEKPLRLPLKKAW